MALEMSRAEKADRMARLQSHIAEHNVYKWLADIFELFIRLREEQDGAPLATLEAPVSNTPVLYSTS
jgi:trehalose-6-phosphate synthase